MPGLAPALPLHIILTTLDESLSQMAGEHVCVCVWVRAAVLTKIIKAGASKMSSLVLHKIPQNCVCSHLPGSGEGAGAPMASVMTSKYQRNLLGLVK